MRRSIRNLLEQNRSWLEEELLIVDHIEMCVQEGILTDTDRDRIKSLKARGDMVLKFLDILKHKADSDFDKFLVILGDASNGQPYIKEHLEAQASDLPKDEGTVFS